MSEKDFQQFFFLKKSYLLLFLQIRASFLHTTTLLWEGIWSLQTRASNLHPAVLRGCESMPSHFVGMQARSQWSNLTISFPQGAWSMGLCPQVFTQFGLSTPKGPCSLSYHDRETPHKQFLSHDLPVGIPGSNPNTCTSMKLLQDYHKPISSLIFVFLLFSVIVRPYLYDNFITSDLQHWLCWGGDSEPNY